MCSNSDDESVTRAVNRLFTPHLLCKSERIWAAFEAANYPGPACFMIRYEFGVVTDIFECSGSLSMADMANCEHIFHTRYSSTGCGGRGIFTLV